MSAPSPALADGAICPSDERERNAESKQKPPIAAVLDARPLDEYLLQLILPRVRKVMFGRYDGTSGESHLIATSWILLPLLRFVLLLSTEGQTPAMKILGLKLVRKTKTNQSSPSRRKIPLLIYATISTILPPVYKHLLRWIEERTEMRLFHQSQLTEMEIRGLQRQRQVLRIIRVSLDRIVSIARLSCVLLCWGGVLSTSDIATGITGHSMRAGENSETPLLQVDYAHRRWLQTQLMSTARILFAGFWEIDTWLPLWKDLIHDPASRVLSRMRHAIVARSDGESENSSCPICQIQDIRVPFEAQPCGHVYCYVCLYNESIRKRQVQCWICSKSIQKMFPR